MASIEKWFSIKLTKAEKLPIPDDKIDITASGTLLTYQGYAGTWTLGNIWVHWGWVDPVDGTFYTYSTNPSKNKYQLLGFFESSEYSFSQNNTFASLVDRYPKVKWDDLGIILNSTTQEPIQNENNSIDIIQSSDEYNFIINNSNNGSFVWSGAISINKWSDSLNAHSCEDILSHFSSEYLENKNYPIISNTWEKIDVFCDMKNGGFTGLFSVNPAWTTWKYDSAEWINPTVKENDFLIQETTFESYSDFDTNSIKICRWDLDHCYTINHNKNIPLHKFYTDDIKYIQFSYFQYLNNYPSDHHYNNNASWPEEKGTNNSTLYLNQLWLTTSIWYLSVPRYSKFGLWINIYERNKLWFQADNNNSWPSFDNFSVGIGGFAPYSNWITSCVWWYPHPYSEATSVHISWQECYIENHDTVMWYVLAN